MSIHGDLTKDQAYAAMQLGEKVAHEYFGDNEYLFIKDDFICSEDGYNFSVWWGLRSEDSWQKGWRIWKGEGK